MLSRRSSRDRGRLAALGSPTSPGSGFCIFQGAESPAGAPPPRATGRRSGPWRRPRCGYIFLPEVSRLVGRLRLPLGPLGLFRWASPFLSLLLVSPRWLRGPASPDHRWKKCRCDGGAFPLLTVLLAPPPSPSPPPPRRSQPAPSRGAAAPAQRSFVPCSARGGPRGISPHPGIIRGPLAAECGLRRRFVTLWCASALPRRWTSPQCLLLKSKGGTEKKGEALSVKKR